MARRWLCLTWLSFLVAVAASCGNLDGSRTDDGPDTSGEGRGGAAGTEETTAPEGGRPVPGTVRGGSASLDVETVSSGAAYVLAGFGEGSLWATDIFVCDDTQVVASSGAAADGSVSSSAECAAPAGAAQPLRRLDPRSGREEAAIPLDNFFANITEVAFGAGSVWVCSGDYYPGPVDDWPGDAVYRIDPQTDRVVDRIPVDSPSGLAFGHDSVWVASAGHGTLSRIDPETGEVAAEIEVGRGAMDVAADERTGAVWVAGLYLFEDYEESAEPEDSPDRKLSRVDPETNRVVAEIPISADTPYGGAQSVAVGEGAVWAQDGGGRLFKVDPAKNEVAATVPLGAYSSHLAVSRGSVWATVQEEARGDLRTRLKRVDPRTVEVTASADLGPVSTGGYGRLAAGGGHVWFVSGAEKKGEVTLGRVAP